MVTKDSQKRAKAKYDAATAKYYSLKLNAKTDSDLIQKLDEVDNKQSYIKRLIREDIERSQ
ncbi:MAG: hypothetical protein IKG01_13965 [Lachnospiraceae bacterium]|nr:hypothetical protein [Lachnospiraceae bacterium]